jgi:acyl-CoA dehydrogenase
VSAESAVLDQPPLSHYFSADHEQFRATLRAFIAAKVTPFVDAWDEAGSFPLELYRSVADLGATGVGFPEAYGGTPGDVFHKIVLAEEYARCGCGGVVASLNSHTIALPPIVAAGSDSLKQRVLPPVLRGERVAALAITEPSGGSDVAAVRTRAVRDGDCYVVNGEKTFITSGMRADFITVAVRTDPASKGATGVSLLLVDGDTAGLTRTAQRKMGWWASDTAHLRFDGCRVPAAHLVGEEHRGFRTIMNNFNPERLFMAAQAYGFAQVCFEEALAWARDRQTFGQPLVERQVIRHKLVDMALRIDAARTLDARARLPHRARIGQPEASRRPDRHGRRCWRPEAMQFCADRRCRSSAAWASCAARSSASIAGQGDDRRRRREVMKDLASRQLEL